MNGEDNYVIIDLWSRIGELSELNWGWVHAQLTGVFRQRNLSTLVHHQVGSSRFSTSSSLGYIQQYFGRLIIHPAGEFHHHTVVPWSETKQFVFLSTGVRTSGCYFYSSQSTFITLPLEEGPFSLSNKQVINSAPFLEDVVLHGRIDLRTFTFWAIEPPFLLHVASITVRGVL